MNERLMGLIGLAMKANKLAVGDGRATDRIRSGNAFLVLVSNDASDNTIKKYTNMCEFRELELLKLDIDRFEFGQSIGRNFAVTAAVCDKGFANSMIKLAERVDK